MAILTPEQIQGNKKEANENRSWVRPVYAQHPNSKRVQEEGGTANTFVFQDTEYPKLKMVGIDRRYTITTGSFDEGNLETISVYTDGHISEHPTHIELERAGEKMKIGYETLVYLPELEAFAIFATPKYSTEFNKAVETVEAGTVLEVTPNIHKPAKSKFPSKLYLYEVVKTDECLSDLEDLEDYASECKLFMTPAV